MNKKFEHSIDLNNSFKTINAINPGVNQDYATKIYCDNNSHGKLPIPISRINGNHEGLDYFLLTAGSAEWVEIQFVAPAGFDFVNHAVNFYIECAWAVEPGAANYTFRYDYMRVPAGSSTIVWTNVDNATVIANLGANLKIVKTATIAANIIVAGDLVRFKFHETGAAAVQTLHVFGISAEMVP
jgi:hypothetical protein